MKSVKYINLIVFLSRSFVNKQESDSSREGDHLLSWVLSDFNKLASSSNIFFEVWSELRVANVLCSCCTALNKLGQGPSGGRVLFSWHWSCKVSLSRRGNVTAMAAAMCVSLESPHCTGSGSWGRSIAGNLCNQRRDRKLGRTQKTHAEQPGSLWNINTVWMQYCLGIIIINHDYSFKRNLFCC